MVKSVLWGASLDLGGSSLTGQLSSHLCGCPNHKETGTKACMNQSNILRSRSTRLRIPASSLQTPSSLETEEKADPKPHWVCSCRSGMPSRLEWDFLARENIPHEQCPPSGPAGYEDGVEEHKIQSRQGSRLLYGQWWRGFESNQSNPLNLHPVASSPITAY